jgi:hypothetical protein
VTQHPSLPQNFKPRIPKPQNFPAKSFTAQTPKLQISKARIFQFDTPGQLSQQFSSTKPKKNLRIFLMSPGSNHQKSLPQIRRSSETKLKHSDPKSTAQAPSTPKAILSSNQYKFHSWKNLTPKPRPKGQDPSSKLNLPTQNHSHPTPLPLYQGLYPSQKNMT